MKTHVRLLAVSAALAALAISLWTAAPSSADDKDLKDAVIKIGAALAKGDEATAKKEVAGLKDADLADVMSLFKPRMRKGIGIGAKPNAIMPDGIETKFLALGGSRTISAKDLSAQADAIAEAAYRAAAIADIAHGKSPVDKKEGAKDPAKWKEWSEEMHKAAIDLANAAKSKNPKNVKDAATKVNASCNHCHEVFRD